MSKNDFESDEILCKQCGEKAIVHSAPEDCGEYNIYCKHCNIDLDENGSEIK